MHKTIIILLLSITSSALFSQEKSEIKKIKASHRTIYTDIIIDAKPEQVWEVLTDFQSYVHWAVFFKGLTGEIKDQGKVVATFQMKAEKDKIGHVDHTIFYEEGKLFGWSEKAVMGIKDNHKFIVENFSANKTRFIQSDELKKGGTWLAGGYVGKLLAEKYAEFNRSLKAEVERRFKK